MSAIFVEYLNLSKQNNVDIEHCLYVTRISMNQIMNIPQRTFNELLKLRIMTTIHVLRRFRNTREKHWRKWHCVQLHIIFFQSSPIRWN